MLSGDGPAPLGGLLGAAQAILIIWLAGGLLAAGPFPALCRAASQSAAVGCSRPVPARRRPSVGEIAAVARRSGLPDVFVGLEPIPLEPVDTPTTRGRTDRRRAPSTAPPRITTRLRQPGDGHAVIVAPDYLVTNAHVVAGASTIRVGARATSSSTRPRSCSTRSSTSPSSMCRASTARRCALRPTIPARGARAPPSATPGGGPLVVLPAAVSGALRGHRPRHLRHRPVTREILELRAAIEPGDSGGPLVLEDGTIGGLVFAESQDRPGGRLRPDADGGRGRASRRRSAGPAAVDLGPCIR